MLLKNDFCSPTSSHSPLCKVTWGHVEGGKATDHVDPWLPTDADNTFHLSLQLVGKPVVTQLLR